MAKKRNIEGERLYHFELSDKNRAVRWVLIIVLLAIGAIAIGIGINAVLNTPPGWQVITPASGTLNCSHEFALTYELGAGEASATAEQKALTLHYGTVTEKAWQIFYNEAGAVKGVNGLHTLNQHLNEEISVEPALYQALQKLHKNGTRALYFGPVYNAYQQVCNSENDFSAEESDPITNPEMKAYIAEMVAYANDPESVTLELRGNNRVYLKISADYATFLKANEINEVLNFGWLRNAFVIDYLAQELVDAGFTNGYLFSVDGFVRNLDQRNTSYNFDIFDQKKSVGTMVYQGGISIAYLSSYPMYQGNTDQYYTYADGRTVVPYIDLNDGQAKTAADQLISYSRELSCAELAMSMLPIYAADSLSEVLLTELTDSHVHSIWFAGKEMRHTEENLQITVSDSTVVTKKVN